MAYAWQYYDVVLLGIALSLGLGVAVGWFTPIPLPVAAAAFAGLGILIIGHGLFVNGPIDAPEDLREPVEALN